MSDPSDAEWAWAADFFQRYGTKHVPRPPYLASPRLVVRHDDAAAVARWARIMGGEAKGRVADAPDLYWAEVADEAAERAMARLGLD